MNVFIKIFVGIVVYLPFSTFNSEQNIKNECACCTTEHNQFDFWIGEWNVYDTIGNLVGENTITSIQDHCVIEENWKSQSGTGTSYNYFDKADSTWNQVWVDNKGGPLVLKGRFNDGKMILRSKLTKGQKIKEFYNQITWQKMPDETVVQTWEALGTNLKSIAVIFKGIYKKK